MSVLHFGPLHATPCNCCSELIPYERLEQLWHEEKMGYVCPECKFRIKVAVAWLKHFGMMTCEYREERGKYL